MWRPHRTPTGQIHRIQGCLILVGKDGKNVNICLSLQFFAKAINLRIPCLRPGNSEGDITQTILAPRLQIGGGLDLNPGPVWSCEVKRRPLFTDTLPINPEGPPDEVLSQEAPCHVADKVRTSPAPEVKQVKLKFHPAVVKTFFARTTNHLDRFVLDHHLIMMNKEASASVGQREIRLNGNSCDDIFVPEPINFSLPTSLRGFRLATRLKSHPSEMSPAAQPASRSDKQGLRASA